MNKIKPLNWYEIDQKVHGIRIEEAIKIVMGDMVDKVNELIEAHNAGIKG